MSNEKVTEQTLESVILSLVDSIANESTARNAELINRLHECFNENEELYETEINLTYLHFVEFAAMPWFAKNKVTDTKNKRIINYIYNGLFPHFVRKTIENNEGMSFSGDKEHFVLCKVKQAIVTGENQSLNATYKGYTNIPEEKWNEKAYWSPTSFTDTDEVMAVFWKWYNVEDN